MRHRATLLPEASGGRGHRLDRAELLVGGAVDLADLPAQRLDAAKDGPERALGVAGEAPALLSRRRLAADPGSSLSPCMVYNVGRPL
jgi:hypothetical protein